MSLGGIAIAVGAMVDAAIVVVEQTHKKLEDGSAGRTKEDYQRVIIEAVKEVGGPSFFALLVIAVSFLPVLRWRRRRGGCSVRWRTPRTSRWSSRRFWPSRSIPRCGCCSLA